MSWLLLWACAQAQAPAEPLTSEPPLARVERLTAGADGSQPLPVVVMLHGLGDTPENFIGALRSWKTPARLVALEAPNTWGDGHAWFTVRSRDADPDALAAQMTEAADRVAQELADLGHASCGKPVVTGFSQGGMLSFTVATQHPEHIAAAVPVAGLMPQSLWPAQASPVPVRALHGDADTVLPFAGAEATVAALQKAGTDATLQGFAGVGHAIPPPVRQAWYSALDQVVCSP